MEIIYKGVVITKNQKSGNYYLVSPTNGTQRIFRNIEGATYFVDNCKSLDSNAAAMRRSI